MIIVGNNSRHRDILFERLLTCVHYGNDGFTDEELQELCEFVESLWHNRERVDSVVRTEKEEKSAVSINADGKLI